MCLFNGRSAVSLKCPWWPQRNCTKPCVHGPLCWRSTWNRWYHYNDVIMGAIASQLTSLMIVFSTVYLDTDQRKHQSSASLAFLWGNHRGPVNSPHQWPVTRKMFPFNDVIMYGGFPTQVGPVIRKKTLWYKIMCPVGEHGVWRCHISN